MSKPYNFLRLAVALCGLFLASCDYVSFERFDAGISVGEKQGYYEGEFVAINFSDAVDEKVAESLVTLKEERMSKDAEFIWNSNLCLVKAEGGFKRGFRYSIAFCGDVALKDGRTYGVDLYREFIYGSEGQNFFAVKIEEPQKNDFERQAIKFTFNKPVDAARFERQFALSPSAEVQKEYSDDMTQVFVLPKKTWKANVFYNWRLENIQSGDGVKALLNYSGSFMALEKTSAPALLLACPVMNGVFMENQSLGQLWETQAVGLSFDSDMDFESVQSGASFVPSVEGSWSKIDSKRFAFSPAESWRIGEEYTLTVRDSIQDVFGLKTGESKNFVFAPRPEWISAAAFANGLRLKQGELNWLELAEGVPLIVELEFSKALDLDSLANIKNCASLERYFPASAAAPNLTTITPRFDSSGGRCFKVQMEYEGFDFSSGRDERIYELTIKGGANFVYNSLGEHMKEDECFLLAIKKRP